jgi:Na+-translocating ferredoxin:NAD+ oxidoreductase RnfG subunit
MLAGLLVAGVHRQLGGYNDEALDPGIPEALRWSMPLTAVVQEVADKRVTAGRYWLATRSDSVVAYAFVVVTAGFNGPVKLLVAVDTSGAVLGTSVLSHREHPGLVGWGATRLPARSLWSLLGVAAHSEERTDESLAVAGATVSTRAVTAAAQNRAQFCLNLIKETRAK